MTAGDDTNATAWLFGQVYYQTRRYDDAVRAYEKAGAAGYPKGMVLYNVACMHALAGRSDNAFDALEEAVQIGFAGVPQLTEDPDLASLRTDTRFGPLVETAKRRASPCMYDDRYRALDFWIGEWDLSTAAGQTIGSQRITSIVGGCAVHEFWTARNGSTGRSFNYYDPSIGKCRQDWVSQTGGTVHYQGEIRDGTMRFEGEAIARTGDRSLQRARLTPEADGRIRHTIESSNDGGKSWTVSFDAWYVRLKK